MLVIFTDGDVVGAGGGLRSDVEVKCVQKNQLYKVYVVLSAETYDGTPPSTNQWLLLGREEREMYF